jgi:hypothetical protein
MPIGSAIVDESKRNDTTVKIRVDGAEEAIAKIEAMHKAIDEIKIRVGVVV